MRKIQILNIEGKKVKEIETPTYFEAPIREDLIFKVLEAKKRKQPYSPSPVAGKQHAAKGKVVHRRHVWRSGYGRGASRVPRKIFSRRGTQFNWEAAEVPHARGGMRAHPPKILGILTTKQVNKKEMEMALKSALSATANEKIIFKKYLSLEKGIEGVPLIIDDKFASLKAKEFVKSLKGILGEDVYEIVKPRKSVRSGRGTMRGRKYKKNAGILIVTGKDEKMKVAGFDIKKALNVGVSDLAKGGPGRITLYTEKAIQELNERFSKEKKK